MNKKMLPLIIGVIAILIVGGGILAYKKMHGSSTTATPAATKKKITLPVNTIGIEQRAYAQLIPEADGHNLTFKIMTVKLAAKEADYETEYQTENLLQGYSSVLQLGSLPASDTKLMGSCSAGGACTYHTNVQGGTITTTFTGGGNDYALKTDWRYLDNKDKEKTITSRDIKFKLTADSLAKVKHMIVFSGYGYPDGLTGTPVSNPFGFAADSAVTGKAELVLKANDTGATKIMGYDGSKWQTYEAKVDADGKTLTATVDILPFYVAVK